MIRPFKIRYRRATATGWLFVLTPAGRRHMRFSTRRRAEGWIETHREPNTEYQITEEGKS